MFGVNISCYILYNVKIGQVLLNLFRQQYVDTKHKTLMNLIYYTRKTENGLNPKNWDLTGKNKGKVMFLPKTWNHPTVVAVILGLAVCQKHVLKA